MGNRFSSDSASSEDETFLTRISTFFRKRRSHTNTVLLVGLNNSGKSTLLCNLHPKLLDAGRRMETEQLSTCPTAGVSLVEFRHHLVSWRVWDLSGQGRFRPLWIYYISHVQGLVFCVDVSDADRIACARDELAVLLEAEKTKDDRPPVLIFANKADLANEALGADVDGDASREAGGVKALTADNVRMALGVENLEQYQKVKVFSSSGLTGAGVTEGFAWLNEMLKLQRRGNV